MQWLLDRFATAPDQAAFVHEGETVAYGQAVEIINGFSDTLAREGVRAGEKVAVLADYAPAVVCLILALAQAGAIVIPLSRAAVVEEDGALAISGCDWFVEFDPEGRQAAFKRRRIVVDHALVSELVAAGRPGLILFSSGSSGAPKAILHDFDRIADKFRKARTATRAIPFLMIDHFGGVNTVLGITSSLGTVVTVADRSVAAVCEAIARNRVELLPATPSFLTLMLASGLHRKLDLSSLKRITYGTEVMAQSTLDRLRAAFPGVELQQTYGLSEVGVLRSQSRPDGSLWVRVGGEGFETRVVDDVLWIRSQYAMLGYLNAPSNFDADGWFNTQDRVEVEGDYIKILGRVSDIINVGGQKVYPAEVEDVILGLDNILDVAVIGEAHALLGQIVVAKVALQTPEPADDLKRRIRLACRASLAAYKAPAKVLISQESFHTARQKKIRRA
ncbi:long-chain fatty acid--CoA ligase [Phenylobacterium sp.]|uniref:class I adenylate-forming enzyme family protein n=1 Tax=Phenylobacterium sp. TaxID=1871053 RepID=UPI00286A712D|nr:long-chain fatty acid--CoA ligase [Phenylobacterium sp.]